MKKMMRSLGILRFPATSELHTDNASVYHKEREFWRNTTYLPHSPIVHFWKILAFRGCCEYWTPPIHDTWCLCYSNRKLVTRLVWPELNFGEVICMRGLTFYPLHTVVLLQLHFFLIVSVFMVYVFMCENVILFRADVNRWHQNIIELSICGDEPL